LGTGFLITTSSTRRLRDHISSPLPLVTRGLLAPRPRAVILSPAMPIRIRVLAHPLGAFLAEPLVEALGTALVGVTLDVDALPLRVLLPQIDHRGEDLLAGHRDTAPLAAEQDAVVQHHPVGHQLDHALVGAAVLVVDPVDHLGLHRHLSRASAMPSPSLSSSGQPSSSWKPSLSFGPVGALVLPVEDPVAVGVMGRRLTWIGSSATSARGAGVRLGSNSATSSPTRPMWASAPADPLPVWTMCR
jgi:hypothetical protein